ncbi:unnamed protein product [Effrenium voratum]|uniref:Nicotinamide phosphoribosyltransferase n=1 Tax=Effrenium voratum TaxID=2562239 RepID=A0AA36MK84_9DINO|nr:unnamed protein product [Effrenium voratum]
MCLRDFAFWLLRDWTMVCQMGKVERREASARPQLGPSESEPCAMELDGILVSLNQLCENGVVEVSRLQQVLVKIGMQPGDVDMVLNSMQQGGRIKMAEFAAWISGRPRSTVPWTDNIILATDSYKFSHWKQYPPGTEYVYSYFESRGCDRDGWNDVVFFGLQYFLKRYLAGQVISQEKIDEAVTMCSEHFVGNGLFYKEGFQYILDKHGGRLPISIKALPEGTVVPTKTALFTMVNTDPKCFWLTNFLETLLVQVWYPMTVCTNSRYQKLAIHEALRETGHSDWAIGGTAFKLHDFGFRGVSSVESAALGGAAHLVNFLGTDTVAALLCTKRYYHAKKAAGFSIPASEHSTITSWGVQKEVDAMRNMLLQYPAGLVACVSDSFDVFKACREYWGDSLKDMIKGRISGDSWGRLVVRPDSGDPSETCVQILQILCEQFKEDVTLTSTGHRLLPQYLRVIQGDGVDYASIPKIFNALKSAGFAAENMVFGSGGALLQKLNRDTFKCAFKCSEITIAGKAREVFKDPVTDKGKASKKGRLTVQKADETIGREEDRYQPRQGESGVPGGHGFLHYSADGQYVTVASGKGDLAKDLLVEVFRDGALLKDWTLDEIRQKADIPNGPFSQA